MKLYVELCAVFGPQIKYKKINKKISPKLRHDLVSLVTNIKHKVTT